MVAAGFGKRNDVASAKDSFAALHIVENLVSEWVAWRSWCQNAEMVIGPPYVKGRVGAEYQIKRVPLKGGDSEANRMSKKFHKLPAQMTHRQPAPEPFPIQKATPPYYHSTRFYLPTLTPNQNLPLYPKKVPYAYQANDKKYMVLPINNEIQEFRTIIGMKKN
ncbi:hypothetical protein NQZ79_g8053 [Umbelopsis isabellina]|nr:hypothetical protein NQZ79_g8053 [Umbelopsis isabellina]